MPMIYTGRMNGMVEVDEYHEIDYGPKLGVTKVGIKWPEPDAEEKARNRETLIRIAQMVIRRQMDKEEHEGG